MKTRNSWLASEIRILRTELGARPRLNFLSPSDGMAGLLKRHSNKSIRRTATRLRQEVYNGLD